ncbi:hypothetical protein J2Z66_003999 [Paenibacillus eucommiae]|uniref:Uncharacterized protein n=1 Tax=Paenibacillus eucommiae TaxID=1355755 RepID=A0ABS4IXS6_9BACL|nr:hypothetical protein [Paenibacillus eucommiae]
MVTLFIFRMNNLLREFFLIYMQNAKRPLFSTRIIWMNKEASNQACYDCYDKDVDEDVGLD